MSRMVSVWLPALPIERLKLTRNGTPFPVDRPFALVGSADRGLALAALNAAAMRAGLIPGLGLADARAICPPLLTTPAEPDKDAACLLALARWSGRYSPSLNVDGDDGLWLDVSGVPHLFGGARALLAGMAKRFARLGFTARLALAETLGGAHALARYAHSSSIIVPQGKIGEALAPLPVEALRLDSDITRLLKRLGLKRIGQLYDLPRTSLERRFHSRQAAEAVLHRLDQALGRREEPRHTLLPAPDYAARLPFPEPLITHEGVVAGLNHLAETLCQALNLARRGARRLQLEIYRADSTSAVIDTGLSAPCREPSHLARLFADRIESVDVGFGVDLMVLAALATEPLLPAQTAFARREGRERQEPLIDRLASRLSGAAVRRLFSRESHIPERAQETRSALAGASPWPEPSSAKPPRPCLLLAEPEPVDVLAEIPEGPPARFTWRRVTRRVVKAEGPERIAPEWWRGLGCRDRATSSIPPLDGEGGSAEGRAGVTGGEVEGEVWPKWRSSEGKKQRPYFAATRLLPHRGRGRAALLGVPRRPLSGERREGSARLVSARGVRVMDALKQRSGSAIEMTRYAELDVTTNFSFLRGGSHAEELVATAKALGLAAIAVTDRNTLAGVVRGHLAAKEVGGIKFIVGCRLDLDDAPSLLAYPTDRAAYGRLCRLLTLGQRRAEKGKCILHLDDVAAHADGLIFIVLPPEELDWLRRDRVTHSIPPLDGEGGSAEGRAGWGDRRRKRTPTPASPSATPDLPTRGRYDASGIAADYQLDFESQLRRIKQVLGTQTRLYLAASHSYRGDDRARIAALAQLAARARTPLVATGAVLYHAAHRRPLQDVLTCIREKCTIHDAGLKLEANAERHLKPPQEMARLFAGHEGALARTIEIADACTFSLDELKYEYPDEPVPEGKTPQSHLEDLTWEGAAWRFPDGIPDKVRDTLEKELALIEELDYARYFLTVHDIVHYARSLDILCQGRGSAANSAVCYCLAITNVDPTEIDLLFERFVSPERKEPPDIDVDFEHERREEVIQYIYGRYGRDRAGIAATVISYRGRSAVREVGKALGLSEDTVAALATTIWGLSNSALPEEYVRQAGLDPSDPLLARCLELTQELLGFPRHLSQHVGGFVLTRGPLSEVVPIGNAAMEDRTFIEWDKDDLDALGLLKVDVLGLGMLTCIRKGFALIKEHYGRNLTLGTVPPDDPQVYDMLCQADSVGVFQVESRAQMNMLPRLKPRKFYDLVIEVAIVRPGPIQGDMVHPYLRRRCGDEAVEFPSPHPDHGPEDELKQVLGKTLGVPLFQEQAMRLAMVAAKFSGPEANELRRAMATFRRRGTIDRLHEKMVSRMVARGYPAEFAERCFNQIKGFGEYGFPESHAASFAHLVYVSAWLKCHYPAAFAAALLNSQPMGFYAPAQIMRCAVDHGVEAREVDINHSLWDCTLEPCAHLEQEGVCGLTANSIPPLDGEGGSAEGRAGWGEYPGIEDPPPPGALSRSSSGAVAQRRSRADLPTRGRYDPTWGFALRLGMRQVDGLREDDVKVIVSIRDGIPAELNPHLFCPPHSSLSSPGLTGRSSNHEGQGLLDARLRGHDKEEESGTSHFRDVRDLWRRSGVGRATLERLAAADAFRSLGHDRRQALWEVRGLPKELPLPLFDHAAASEAGAEPQVTLPIMPLSEHVVNDYRTLRLSLKAHPMSFLRARIASENILSCADLKRTRDGARVSVAGVVLVRQRPGSAAGVVFMTIEDETGVANSVIWPKVLERMRKVVMGARLVVVHGRIQRHEDIIHVVAERLEDRSDWLRLLDEEADSMSVPVANADEVKRPDPGSWRSPSDEEQTPFPVAPADHVKRPLAPRETSHPRWHPRRHPRAERIIPKSRDFH